MTENASDLSLKDAVRSLADVESVEPLLRARIEGLTTMLWGLVTAAVFLSYQVVHASAGHDGNQWLGFLWVPWVLAGTSATIVIWRSAHLTAGTGAMLRHGLVRGLPFLSIFLLAFAGALLAYFVIGDLGRLQEPGYMTLVLGVAAFVLAASPIPRSSASTRSVHLSVGTLAILAALLVAFVIRPTDPEVAFLAQTMVGASAVGGAWFVGGLIQAGKR